jgi:hypothetical protein
MPEAAVDHLRLRDLLDVIESWLVDDCPPEAREEYRGQLHQPVTKTEKVDERRREVFEVAAALGVQVL